MFIRILGLVVTIIFSAGAVIGAMITMYAAVANRTVEIGTLRALGFRRRNILTAFLVESLLLALTGGAVGLVFASLLQFFTISTINFGSFAELAFSFSLSPSTVISSMLFSLLMGLVGGFLPAARAARLNIVNALRAS
jgi:ABC-type antimicrobial peptide transport system permease subunit